MHSSRGWLGIFRECPKFWSQREIIFGNERPDLRLITDKQLSTFIKETEEDFPWFPPTNTNEDIENDPDQESIASYDGIRPWEQLATPERELPSPVTSDVNNPGFDLFDSDSDDDSDSNPEDIVLPSSDTEEDPVEDPDIPNVILPIVPNRGQLNPESNWLQSSSDNDTDPDHDQFLLNADDLYSDDAWSSCSDAMGNDLGQNEFDINDDYIDDDLLDNNTNVRLLEPTQDPEETHSPVELDQYLLDPEGLNLIDPFTMNHSDNADAHVGDPEPNQGPFDPG